MFSLFKKNKTKSDSIHTYRININHCFPENWESFENFKLYSKKGVTLIDLLIFASEYGILSGEKINWKYSEIKKATVERSSPLQKKKSTTQLSIKDAAIRNKLQNVLSFDSTPIAHFFWLPYLREEEFDLLHNSFHDLLPKEQVIFSDEPCTRIHEKLSSLLPQLETVLDHNKIAGALEAHHQILPHDGFLFGLSLPYREKLFLHSCTDVLCTIAGPCGSGRTSLLVRKALQHRLEHPDAELYFISPNQLNNDLIRQEFLSLLDFAVIELNKTSLIFLTPSDLETKFERLSLSSLRKDLLLIDDFQLYDSKLQNHLMTYSPIVRTICTVEAAKAEYFELCALQSNPQDKDILPAADSWDEVFSSLINVLHKYRHNYMSDEYLIIIPESHQLVPLQLYLQESKEIISQIVDEFFSLQYKNVDSMILTTPLHVSGIRKKAVILIGIEETEYESYPYLLSRGTDKAIIIPYHNPIEETITDENHEERSGMEGDIIA